VQLSEWEAYDRLDPIGTWREDFRTATLASIVTNLVISVHGKKGAKMTTAIDFMPDWGEQRAEIGKVVEKQDNLAEQIKSIFGAIANKKKQQAIMDKREPVLKQKKT
jgi:hypothetical protein